MKNEIFWRITQIAWAIEIILFSLGMYLSGNFKPFWFGTIAITLMKFLLAGMRSSLFKESFMSSLPVIGPLYLVYKDRNKFITWWVEIIIQPGY